MAVVGFELQARGPYEEAAGIEGAGPYERIEGVAHYAVRPGDEANAGIVDLDLAPRDDQGLVRWSGDVSLLLPLDPTRANRAVLLDVPNRGNRMALRGFAQAEMDLGPTDRIAPGDGFLLRHGWAVAWAAWQWDVPRGPGRLGFDPPLVPPERLGADPGRMQLRLQLPADAADVALTDQHVGAIGAHRPIPPARGAGGRGAGAELWVRDGLDGAPQRLDDATWRFARDEGGRPVADDEHVWLAGGFEAGRIYDLLYRPQRCPVVGTGLLSVRDLAAWLRHGPDAPTAGALDHVLGTGQSQCGRFLRTFLELGLNLDEAGRQVFDGLLVHIAGGRRGEFNHRWAQPSVQPTPGFGHLPPHSDDPHPGAGHDRGLLDRQRARGGVPKVVSTDTSSEYWRGDASLTHAALDGSADLPLDGDADAGRGADATRRYLFAGTQHGAGFPVLTATSLFGSRGGNTFNIVDYRPLSRAALHNLLAWVADGLPPPPSRVPRLADGTAATRQAVLADLAALPGLALPDPGQLPTLRPLDLGPGAAAGRGEPPARPAGPDHVALVSTVDADGNEVAGVRLPDVAVPVGTHTGFDPRAAGTGGEGQLLDYLGSTLPLAVDEATRAERGDPRPSLAARYADRDGYLVAVRAAAEALVAERLLLAEDVELCQRLAAARWDLVTRPRRRAESTATG